MARIQEAGSVRIFPSRPMVLAAAWLGVASGVTAQAPRSEPSAWTFTIDGGGFIEGNRQAVTSWLRRNSYGVAEPRHCGVDALISLVCGDPEAYPRVRDSGVAAGIVSVRRLVSDRWSVELFAATEQGGIATGRCDDLATPKDPRCTNRFIEVPFGGGSFALLGVATAGHFRLGAGPALLLANWEMQPAHLAGVWVDATLDRDPSPFFVRAQGRIYRATSLAPEQGFSGFHPSTLFVGLGVMIRTNNTGL
jgi:hypothetical protein